MMIKSLMAAGALMLAASAGQAATYNLNLSGQVANFTTYTAQCCGVVFDGHSLDLTGLDGSNAITVSQGDMINATVTLDQAYTMPASPLRTDFLLFLRGSSFPNENTGVNGTFTLFDGATQVGQFNTSSTTSGQLALFAAVFPPDNHAYTFDSFTADLTIYDLATPATLDGSNFTYSLDHAVPEPTTWALMMLGVLGLGAALRRRQAAFAV